MSAVPGVRTSAELLAVEASSCPAAYLWVPKGFNERLE